MSGHEGDEGAVLDAITDEEAEAAARRDPDNPPLTDEETQLREHLYCE